MPSPGSIDGLSSLSEVAPSNVTLNGTALSDPVLGDFSSDVYESLAVLQNAAETQFGDRFKGIQDNPFRDVAGNPLSTFSIDVDTASYSKVRMYLSLIHL